MLINTAFLLAGNRGSVRVRLRCSRSPGSLLLLLLWLLLLLAILYVLLLLLLVLGLRSIPVRCALLHRHGVLHVHLLLLWGLLLVGRIRRGISGRVHRVLWLLLLVGRWRPVGLLLRLMLLWLLVRHHLTLLLHALLRLALLGHTSGGLGRIQVLWLLLLLKVLALYGLELHRILSDHALLLQRWLLLECDRGLLLLEKNDELVRQNK